MTSSRKAVPINPLPSATPVLNIATRTVPNGAKPVKLVIISVTIRCNPKRDSRLMGSTAVPVVSIACCGPRRFGLAGHRSPWVFPPDNQDD